MRIAILLPDLRGGGVERIRLVLAHQFASLGHEVEFVLMRARGELLGEALASFVVTDLECDRMRRLPFVLARHLRFHPPDALLAAMWPITVAAPIARLLSRRRFPMLISEHGILSAQYRNWGRMRWIALRVSTFFGYRLAHRCVGVSGGVADDMAQLSRLPRERIQVVHNPVPPRPEPSAAAMAAAETLWNGPRGGRIITVGRFKAVKNHPLLLRAFALLDRPEARLMLVGNGETESELRRLATELGIDNRVIFGGFRPDPTPLYRSADLFVLSSDYEGFGNVIVEALACGTPVVATDCPSGPREILVRGEFGTLAPVGNADALARAMQDALEGTHDCDSLRDRARDFSPERAARAYLDLLGSGEADGPPEAELWQSNERRSA